MKLVMVDVTLDAWKEVGSEPKLTDLYGEPGLSILEYLLKQIKLGMVDVALYAWKEVLFAPKLTELYRNPGLSTYV